MGKGFGTMTIALWIIAICEVIRCIQNMLQLGMYHHDKGNRDNAYSTFIQSIKESDREYVKRMLLEFDKLEKERNEHN